jgi:hypothetical protein
MSDCDGVFMLGSSCEGFLREGHLTSSVALQGMGVNIKEMYESRHNVAVIIFFVVFEFFISIVMLNTLVSVMVGAFDRVSVQPCASLIGYHPRLSSKLRDCADLAHSQHFTKA